MSRLRFDKSDVIKLITSIPKGASIQLVGDHGVYLMSFSENVKQGEKRTVVYAHGCNPKLNEDFYDTKVELYGGDDGCDELKSTQKILQIAMSSDKYVYVTLTQSSIKVDADRRSVVKPTVDVGAPSCWVT